MNTRQLRASLALWRRRYEYRSRRHRFYHHHSKRPDAERRRLAEKWHELTVEAERMVERRERELAARRSARERAVRLAESCHGRTEQPAGSNRSSWIDGMVRAVGSYLAAPWCGIFCGWVMKKVGVKGVTSRIAAVSFIEDDARAGRAPFRGWTTNPNAVQRGDLVVVYGRGVHVELVRYVKGGVVFTVGGNTSSGSSGSQSNGGGCYKRARPMGVVHGFALVDYPNT